MSPSHAWVNCFRQETNVLDAAASWFAGIYVQEERMAVKGAGVAHTVFAAPMTTIATDRRGL
jgi:hypothetical protein